MAGLSVARRAAEMVLTMADAKAEEMDGKMVEKSAEKTDDAKAAWMVSTRVHLRVFWKAA